MRCTQAQFEIMINFMERNGDLSKPLPGAQGSLSNYQQWLQLVELLNDKSKGDPKPLEKWRKAWSDLKNCTKRKVAKIKRQGGIGPTISDLEKRVLKLLQSKGRKRKVEDSDDGDDELIFNKEIEQERCKIMLSAEPFFTCPADEQPKRRKSASSCSSSSSAHPPEKRKKHEYDDITERYLEFEREREKMAHEREMARIKQNEQIISIFGRIVNVFETLAPSVQRYLDRDANDNG